MYVPSAAVVALLPETGPDAHTHMPTRGAPLAPLTVPDTLPPAARAASTSPVVAPEVTPAGTTVLT